MRVYFNEKRQAGNETCSPKYPELSVPACGYPVGSHPDTQRNPLNLFYQDIRLFCIRVSCITSGKQAGNRILFCKVKNPDFFIYQIIAHLQAWGDL